MSQKERPEFCPDSTPGFAYARTKALRYHDVGPDVYREGDFFNLPKKSWEPEILVWLQSGCEQMADCIGYLPEKPLEGLGVGGIYKLIELLHFERIRVDSSFDEGYALDKMTLKHSVTGSELILYNRVITEYFQDKDEDQPVELDL